MTASESFSKLLSVLTESTWGISVSLKDFKDLAFDSSGSVSKAVKNPKKAAAPGDEFLGR
jgi:hypothetical protein